MSIEAMKQVLEALEGLSEPYYVLKAQDALRTAIAEASKQDVQQEMEQEPVAWQWLDTGTFRKSLPSSAEPGAWNPLYTTPPRREWVGLTEEELEMLELKHAPPVHPEFVKDDDWWEFARAIEAKLKEKNS